jgi:hypothetical protein
VEAHACILYMPDKVTWMKLKDASMDGRREAAVKLISPEAQILSSILGRSVYETAYACSNNSQFGGIPNTANKKTSPRNAFKSGEGLETQPKAYSSKLVTVLEINLSSRTRSYSLSFPNTAINRIRQARCTLGLARRMTPSHH